MRSQRNRLPGQSASGTDPRRRRRHRGHRHRASPRAGTGACHRRRRLRGVVRARVRGAELDSHILLSVVLPPLLYSAALDFSFPTFLRNIRPILGLGVGLVVVTAFAVAGIASWLVPSADVRDRADPRRDRRAARRGHRGRGGPQARSAEKGDGDPHRRESDQRCGGAVPVLHRGRAGRGQPDLHREPAAAVHLQRRTRVRWSAPRWVT